MTLLFRVFRFAAKDFWRNIWLSLVTTSILALAFISVNILLVLNIVGRGAITAVQEKIDVAVYLVPNASEDVVKTVRSYLLALPQVTEARVTTPEEALARFRDRHAANSVIAGSLDTLEKNPLGPSLSVKARDTSDYPTIMRALENPAFSSWIAEKSYDDHRLVIERLERISAELERASAMVTVVFLAIAILIVFNAVRIAIYTHREEIGIMKLVGASNFFIRTPFMVQGVYFCLLGLLIASALVIPSIRLLSPSVAQFFGGSGVDLFTYYRAHAPLIFGLQLFGGVLLTTAASGIAVGKYLRR